MKRDPHVSLRDMLESIELIVDYTDGCDLEDFLEDRQLQDAVIRRLEIVGEAVKNLPDDLRAAHDDIRWSAIAGLRDILIHGYFQVNLNRVWNVVQRDLPPLKDRLSAILSRR